MRRNTDLSLRGVPEQEFYCQEQSLPVAGASSLHIDSTDSSRMKKQLSLIKAMAQLSSSGVTVYDLHKKVHVYTSRNFYQLFGYGISENQTEVENEVFDRRIHPEDLKALAKNGYVAMKYLMSLPPEQRISQEFRLSIHPKNHAPECTAAIASRVIFSCVNSGLMLVPSLGAARLG